MGSKAETAQALEAALAPYGTITTRKMFGEYGIYLGEKIPGCIADDMLYVRVTEPGKALYPDAELAPPYPGAKDHMVVPEDKWSQGDWLWKLLVATADAQPAPKPKKPKKPK